MILTPQRKLAIAQVQHFNWVRRLQVAGIKSRTSYWGEELMQHWDQLSPRAQEYNIDGVDDFLAAFELTDNDQPCPTP
jgi:hypothetical protein